MIKKEKSYLSIIVPIVVFFIGCGAMYGLLYAFPDVFSTNVTKLEKNVTINDSGIAESVEKVYDAVVIVKSQYDNQNYASGTGFVYKTDDKNAYILTNNHVIEDGKTVTVNFTNGKVIEATVVGADALSDIAVLSVDKKDIISVAEIGSSDDLKVGDTSFAVGAPIDSVYSWTVTRGIISGKDRMVEVTLSKNSGDYVMKVLQTDAAINSGNSGGPLCNANGEVVGVTSLKLVNESIEGMGFAIPIEVAIDYASKIMKGEDIAQPYLGISMLNVAEALYNAYSYGSYYKIIQEADVSSGVIVVTVEKNTPAQKAGLESGDIITKINNDNVSNIAYLRYYLYNYSVGDKVTLTYIRDGKTKTATVTLGSNKVTY